MVAPVPVPAAAFTPRPKVDSAVVHFIPNSAPSPVCDIEALEELIGRDLSHWKKATGRSERP